MYDSRSGESSGELSGESRGNTPKLGIRTRREERRYSPENGRRRARLKKGSNRLFQKQASNDCSLRWITICCYSIFGTLPLPLGTQETQVFVIRRILHLPKGVCTYLSIPCEYRFWESSVLEGSLGGSAEVPVRAGVGSTGCSTTRCLFCGFF